jgi:ribosomal protein L7/L12/DNA-directed RNA polymerase subunit RPC12/RpoP
MPNTFNCPSCGAPLDIDADSDPVIRCPYCKGTVVVPPDLRLPAVGKKPQAPVVLEGRIGSAFQQAAQLAEVTRLAQAGQKIEAIKLFRQLTGVGLKDAKDVVDGIAAGQPFTLSSLETSQPVLNKSAMLNEVARLVEVGNKLEAIKVYRETFDVSLAEAKAAVYVSDAKGLQVFEADGRYLDKFEVNGFVFGIDINDKNEIFTVANDQKVSKFIMKVP